MIPTAIFAFLFLGYHIVTIPFAVLGVTSALLALILNFEYAFIFGATTFWTKSYYGTRALKEGMIYLFGGWLIPITLYPLMLQNILYYTPLPYINFFPNMIFIGKYSITSALFIIMLQIFWVIILYGIYGIVWHFAKKKFTGVGV